MKKRQRRFRGVIIALLAIATFGWWLESMEAKVPMAAGADVSYSSKTDINIGDYSPITMNMADIHRGNLILVNPQNAYQPSGDTGLVSIYSHKNNAYKVKDKNVLLNEPVVTALNNMMTDFYQAKSDSNVIITSGYRTQEEQRRILDDEIARKGEAVAAMYVANPGFSEHHSGLAIDLGLYYDNGTSASFDGTGKYQWITENCRNYGFIVRYLENKTSITKVAYEPWHLRYVGIPHAFLMKEKGFCFEEYMDFILGFQFGEKHLEVSVNGKEYEIYFTAGTNPSIPADGSYDISGNNLDGFIVTITK